MRILVLLETNWLEKGPAQHHHLFDRLSERGHEIHVIDYDVLWREKEWLLISGKKVFKNVSKVRTKANITVIRPPLINLPLLEFASVGYFHMLEILREVKSFRPDVIVGFDILNTYLGLKIAKVEKIPFICYLIDSLHTLIPVKQLQPIGKFLEMKTLRQSDLVLVISDELKRYAINLGADSKKVKVIRAGIDNETFNTKVDVKFVREKYGIDRDELVLFFMGWLYPFSGLKEVAFSLLKHEGKPKRRLIVVGRGELYGELVKLKKNGLKDKLILVNWQPYEKIPRYIAASDICLLPAYNNEVMRNIVPIKMYEYMACGKPVISTKLPGIMKEFGYDNGVIYVDEPAEVSKKAIELYNDGSIREQGAKAMRFVEKHSWDKITDEFQDILDRVRS